MLPCQQRKSLITFVSEIQQSSYLVKRSPGTKAFQFYAVAMETLVTMATEKSLITFVSEIRQSSYLLQWSPETPAFQCLYRCYGNSCYHGNRENS